ncbi:MAG TPA: hypothetical protein VFD43_11610 [Planctomycetota bacterium]|nr:hypothetical protein [Planctomycetota bacterium]
MTGTADPTRSSRRQVNTALVAFGWIALVQGFLRDVHAQDPVAPPCAVARAEAGLPGGLIENVGQWGTDALYIARVGSNLVRAETGAICWQHESASSDGGRSGSLVRLSFEGSREGPRPEPVGLPLPGECHYLLGNEPTGWRSHVRRYASVSYGRWYDGVVVELAADETMTALRIRLEPNCDLEAVRLRIDGSRGMSLEDGQLVLGTVAGEMRLRSPRPSGGTDDALPYEGVRYRLLGENVVGLARPEGTGNEALVIDLQVEWSTYLGGTDAGEYIYAVALDAEDRAVVAGETRSMTFPTTPGAFDTNWNGGFGVFANDAFVTCLEADGSALVFSTFLGGSANEYPHGLGVDPSGSVLLAGWTASPNFPTTAGAWDTSYGGGDGFVTKLLRDGSGLAFSTYVGGSKSEFLYDLAEFPDGRIAVCGETYSPDFPATAGAFDPTFGGGTSVPNGFLAILDARGETLEYGTFMGGRLGDRAHGVTVRPDGTVALAGRAGSPDFPVTPGAFDTAMVPGEGEGFVLVIDTATSVPVYSTFLGPCHPRGIQAHADGSVIVSGHTSSTQFPTTPGSFDPTYNEGTQDGFVLRLNPAGSG